MGARKKLKTRGIRMSDIGTAAWFAEIEYYNLKRGRESERNKNLDGLITELNKLGLKKQQVLVTNGRKPPYFSEGI